MIVIKKKPKHDDIIDDNELLELLDKYVEMKIYMSEPLEGDIYVAPLDRSNPLRALFYLCEKEDPPVSLFRCANLNCQEIIPYKKNLLRARRHALTHYNTLVRDAALAQVQGPTISMGPRDAVARAAVLFSIVENVSIAALHSQLILQWYSAMLLSAAHSFVVLEKMNKDVLHSLARAHVEDISHYTAHKITVEFADIVERCLLARIKNAVAVHLASDGWEHFGHHFFGVLAFVVEVVDGALVRNVYCLGLPYFNNLESHDGSFIACID